jgi:hypothetical protein
MNTNIPDLTENGPKGIDSLYDELSKNDFMYSITNGRNLKHLNQHLHLEKLLNGYSKIQSLILKGVIKQSKLVQASRKPKGGTE